ncbi:MAG: PulJ/GspJ family protein [Planctomycetota bacterium]|jgi:type II secretory pathway pseudopilin PulG
MHAPAHRASPARAFTFVELIISLAITSILMFGLASALMIATRSVDDGTTLAARTAAGAPALDGVTADLRLALEVTEITATSIEFTVPDRSDPPDGTPETIRYSWSGEPGDALLRRYNGSSAAIVTDDVHHFDLSMVTRSVPGVVPATPTPNPLDWGSDFVTCPDVRVSSEVLLAVHTDAAGGTLNEYGVHDQGNGRFAAQSVLPVLPSNAMSWTVSRTFLRLRRTGDPGAVDAELQLTNDVLEPGGTVLDLHTFDSTPLGAAFEWFHLPFAGEIALDTNAMIAVVLRTEVWGWEGSASAVVQYESDGAPMTPSAHFMTSNNGGNSWSSPNETEDALFYVFGTVTTCGAPVWPDGYPLVPPNPPHTLPTVFEKRIASSTDDAEETVASGVMSLDSGDLDLGTLWTHRSVGMRFRNVAIPAGATILEAWIQFDAYGSHDQVTALNFHGEAADDAATYTNAAFNLSTRPLTTAAVPWVPDPWVVDEAGEAQRTPDLASIVQEIVDRPGWASGNALNIMVFGDSGKRKARTWDDALERAPLLHIRWMHVP